MGQFKTKERTLKNSEDKSVVVKVTLFTGFYGLEILTKIISKISPTLLNAINSKGKSIADLDIDFKEISNNIVSNLLDGSVLELLKEITASTVIDNVDLSNDSGFDIAFCGEYGLLIDTITFILEANYKSFLAGKITKILKNKILQFTGEMKKMKGVSKK